MFKLSLLLLSIILLLIALDSNYFEEKTPKRTPIKVLEERQELSEKDDEIRIIDYLDKDKKSQEKVVTLPKEDIYLVLKKIINQAQAYYEEENLEQALAYYDKVIKRSKDSQNIKVLKLFALANFRKAFIYKRSQHEGYGKIINCYDTIIKRFKDQSETELLQLYAKAQFYKANFFERDKSLNIYDEVIRKFSKTSDIKLLKIYTTAQFNKSYLTSGHESLDIFNQIIEKLRDQDDEELLTQLHMAQSNKAYTLEKYMNRTDEAVEVYDDIISIFSTHKGQKYKSIVDNAFFQKSFLLMGKDDEASMEIYDGFIEKYEREYQQNSDIPLKLNHAIINNIELSLITNNDDTAYKELAEKYLEGDKDSKVQIDMLEILKNAQISNQDEALEAWKEENKDYSFYNWSFTGLKQWNNEMEEGEEKRRIKNYLDEFIKHNAQTQQEVHQGN